VLDSSLPITGFPTPGMADIVAHVQPETSYRLTGSKRPRYEVPRNDAWVRQFQWDNVPTPGGNVLAIRESMDVEDIDEDL